MSTPENEFTALTPKARMSLAWKAEGKAWVERWRIPAELAAIVGERSRKECLAILGLSKELEMGVWGLESKSLEPDADPEENAKLIAWARERLLHGGVCNPPLADTQIQRALSTPFRELHRLVWEGVRHDPEYRRLQSEFTEAFKVYRESFKPSQAMVAIVGPLTREQYWRIYSYLANGSKPDKHSTESYVKSYRDEVAQQLRLAVPGITQDQIDKLLAMPVDTLEAEQ